jgi:ABC-type multidrug transport system ATPase subunit
MDGGSAKVFGLDVRTQMDRIRKLVGVCPQFDILWDELTAEEHLLLYASLKQVRIGPALLSLP